MTSRPPVRVLVDLSVAPPGGAGTYAAGFARGLVDGDIADRRDIVVLLDRGWAEANQQAVDVMREAGITVDCLSLARPGTWRARLIRGSVLRRAVERHSVDVAFFPRDAVTRMRRPYVLLANNLYAWQAFASSAAIGGRLPAYLLRHVAHRSARGAVAVLAVSQTMAAAMADDIEVAAIIHHGCSMVENDRALIPDDPDAARVVAMIGNVIANKGIEVVIAAVARAGASGDHWDLRVYGNRADPAYVDRLERQAQECLGGSVLAGPAYGDDLVGAYQQADVVVMGGTFESFCFPLVEAMRSGCVVVAPACPLVDEICGDIAVTYEADDAASLALALGVAWDERLVRRQRGLRHSRTFSWAIAAEKTIAHLRSAARSV